MRWATVGLAMMASTASGPAACATEAGRGELGWIGKAGPERIEGRIRVVGSQPFTRPIIEPEEGPSVTVTGPYRAEIGRLAGAIVRLTGRTATADLPGPALEATSYEILSVDGDRAVLGTLVADEEGFALVSGRGEEVRLREVPDAVADRIGGVVWVVLDDRGSVARYGILREPT